MTCVVHESVKPVLSTRRYSHFCRSIRTTHEAKDNRYNGHSGHVTLTVSVSLENKTWQVLFLYIVHGYVNECLPASGGYKVQSN